MTRIWNRMRTGIAVILIILLMCGSVFGIWSAVDARKAYDVPALTAAELTDLDLSHAKRMKQSGAGRTCRRADIS